MHYLNPSFILDYTLLEYGTDVTDVSSLTNEVLAKNRIINIEYTNKEKQIFNIGDLVESSFYDFSFEGTIIVCVTKPERTRILKILIGKFNKSNQTLASNTLS